MIKLSNIYKKFKETTIFEGLNGSFELGQVIRIKGSNGTGKSVLLKLITGYALPDSGAVTAGDGVIGKDFDFLPDTGLFINSPEFLGSFSGLENLKFLNSFNKKSTEEEMLAITHRLGLTMADLNKMYKKYSLGMRQKLRLTQALMEKPKYLVLDEPFDGLDKQSIAVAIELLNQFMDPSKLIIYVSHSDYFDSSTTNFYEIENCTLVSV